MQHIGIGTIERDKMALFCSTQARAFIKWWEIGWVWPAEGTGGEGRQEDKQNLLRSALSLFPLKLM